MLLNQYILHLSSFKKVRMTGSLAITLLLERERERKGDWESIDFNFWHTLFNDKGEWEKWTKIDHPFETRNDMSKNSSDDEKWVVIYFTRMIYERAQMILLSFPKKSRKKTTRGKLLSGRFTYAEWTKESRRLRADLESKARRRLFRVKKTTDYDHGERVVIKKVTHDHSN